MLSNHLDWRCSAKKAVQKNFAKIMRKHLWQSLIFSKVVRKETQAQEISLTFATFKKTSGWLPLDSQESKKFINCSEASLRRCSYKKLLWNYAANLQENTHAQLHLFKKKVPTFFFVPTCVFLRVLKNFKNICFAEHGSLHGLPEFPKFLISRLICKNNPDILLNNVWTNLVVNHHIVNFTEAAAYRHQVLLKKWIHQFYSWYYLLSQLFESFNKNVEFFITSKISSNVKGIIFQNFDKRKRHFVMLLLMKNLSKKHFFC